MSGKKGKPLELVRGERFHLARPPRIFWGILGILLFCVVAILFRMRTVERYGGFMPNMRRPIFHGIEAAAWWIRTLLFAAILGLILTGLLVWSYERVTKRRIRLFHENIP